MAYLDYRRHFIYLGAAIVVLACVSRLAIYEDPLFASTTHGVLYAGTLIGSLTAPATTARKLVFVAIAAALSILSLYVGIIALVGLSVLPDGQRLPAVIALAAATGAITYGSLIRKFWIRGVRPRRILALAVICALAMLGAYLAKLKFELPGMWWLAAIWWLAFSLSSRWLLAPPTL
jgi:hypothetical protein